MKQMFRDAQVQAEFEANGFVKLPWLSEEDVAELRALYLQVAAQTPDGFFTSYAVPDAAMKTAVRDGILKLFELRLRATFVDPLPLLCSFITKTRGDGKAEYISAHQDWTFVDETEGFVSINIWCPLEPTSDHNGNLCLVPGSNHLRRYPRLAEPGDNPYKAYYDLLKQASVAVPTSLGEALLFDNAVIHFSTRNQTESQRLVAGAMVVDQSAKQVLYYQNADDGGMVDEYRSNIDYFIQKPFGARPDTFLRSIPKTPVPAVADEIRTLFPQIRMPDITASVPPPASSQVPLSPALQNTRSFFGRAVKRLFG